MLIIIPLATLLVIVAVLMHYHGLTRIARFAFSGKYLTAHHLVMVILCVLCLHLAEILVFSGGIYISHNILHLGDFKGDREFNLIDYFHISAETFVTVGYGDLYPVGPLRVITSLESLTGILLVSWSGAFSYFTIQEIWKRQNLFGDQ